MLETAPRYDPVLMYLNAIMDSSLRLADEVANVLDTYFAIDEYQVYHIDPL